MYQGLMTANKEKLKNPFETKQLLANFQASLAKDLASYTTDKGNGQVIDSVDLMSRMVRTLEGIVAQQEKDIVSVAKTPTQLADEAYDLMKKQKYGKEGEFTANELAIDDAKRALRIADSALSLDQSDKEALRNQEYFGRMGYLATQDRSSVVQREAKREEVYRIEGRIPPITGDVPTIDELEKQRTEARQKLIDEGKNPEEYGFPPATTAEKFFSYLKPLKWFIIAFGVGAVAIYVIRARKRKAEEEGGD